MAALCCLKDSVIQVLNWDVAGFQEPGNVSCRAVVRYDLGAPAEEEGWEMLVNNR
jgi:hypothetical protein